MEAFPFLEGLEPILAQKVCLRGSGYDFVLANCNNGVPLFGQIRIVKYDFKRMKRTTK